MSRLILTRMKFDLNKLLLILLVVGSFYLIRNITFKFVDKDALSLRVNGASRVIEKDSEYNLVDVLTSLSNDRTADNTNLILRRIYSGNLFNISKVHIHI